MTEKILNAVQDDTVVQLAYNLVVDGEEIEFEVLEYLHGHQNIIPGLENALTGLAVGESKEVLVLAEDAYG
ncbi:MAG TPA: FKBP-type peptidyl-prolyl cis-trans isomerase, partial [Anaerolineaceae bacterium]|nr:FKBP-type peptidyl-prolyl cis-trans isomerase [Anaerolineaceae bacterium]